MNPTGISTGKPCMNEFKSSYASIVGRGSSEAASNKGKASEKTNQPADKTNQSADKSLKQMEAANKKEPPPK